MILLNNWLIQDLPLIWVWNLIQCLNKEKDLVSLLNIPRYKQVKSHINITYVMKIFYNIIAMKIQFISKKTFSHKTFLTHHIWIHVGEKSFIAIHATKHAIYITFKKTC